jgi:hypothetical protein
VKILIFGFTKLRYMPYMSFYLTGLKNEGHRLHILSWNRDGQDDEQAPEGVVHHNFQRLLEDEIPKIKKIPAFAAYRKHLIGLIKDEKFDFLISLHTLPGVLIYKRLENEYKNRFILDYRDFTYENIKPFAKIIKSLAEASALTFVSSDRFRKYLPDIPKILTSHNIKTEDLQYRADLKFKPSENGKIRVCFWGLIRHEHINLRIIRMLSPDDRFELHYYGREQETARKLKVFCRENSVKNVFFHGQYSGEDKYKIAENTDIIHNMYDNGSTEEIALGNKHYDGLLFYLPQICFKGSYMGFLAEKYGIGISLNPYEEGFANKLWEYYNSLDKEVFIKACDKRLLEIMQEYEKGVRAVKAALPS